MKLLEIMIELYFSVLVWGVLYSLLDANGLIVRVVAWSDNNRLKFHTTYMNDALKVISPIKIAQLYGTLLSRGIPLESRENFWEIRIRRNKPILAICVYHLRDDY